MVLKEYNRIDKLINNVLKYKSKYPFAIFKASVVTENNCITYSLRSNYGDLWKIIDEYIFANKSYRDYLYNWNSLEYKLNNNLELFNYKCKKCLFKFYAHYSAKFCTKCKCNELYKWMFYRRIHNKLIAYKNWI